MNNLLESIALFLNTNTDLSLFSQVYIGFMPHDSCISINIKDGETKTCLNGGKISTIDVQFKVKNRDFLVNQTTCDKLYELFTKGQILAISSGVNAVFVGCEGVPIIRHDGMVMGGLVLKVCVSEGEWVDDD